MNPAVSHPANGKLNIAAALHEIGILLELKGARYFQARAYKAAARILADLESSVTSLISENRLTAISGIGSAIAAQIKELDRTGTSRMLEQLRSELPRGALELATVPGLSLKKIEQLQDALGIGSVAELKSACERGEVRKVKGFGPKTEQKLLESISVAKKPRNEINIHKGLRLAEEVVNYLRFAKGVKQLEIAGPLRRWRETTPDITIVVAANRAATVLDHFAAFPLLIRILDRTPYSLVAILNTGVKVSLSVVSPNNFAATLLNATGSDAHLERLREVAATRHQTIELNGLKARSGKATVKTESELYDRLGMQYVAPELRENEGEIEAALAGKLPEDLVTLADIHGMLHCHTNYSDGKHTVEEMARGAEALGMSYLTITDHSPTAFYAGGLKVDRLKRQWEEIARVQETVKVKLLRGTESDILADGSLDYPDHILEQFDVIIASIHSRYRMDENQMTERVIKAMRQPWFKIWGHALGRIIQHRPPFNARVEEILDVISESRVAVEINGDPYRLDMEPRWIREARKRKIKFVISTDAHSINGMKNLKFGVGIARRGWVRRTEVLNSLSATAFVKAVRPNQKLA
ncbi:MAG TPA: DNA polymerase/3'-5' exonuclease PolX [Pyrinomonadaceae bacterium]|jgi:DNA polymerase (family 10)|nr:DNA polymerase/3'-5' exonuclease PolX [Pyrinomonadaceae bacterium]